MDFRAIPRKQASRGRQGNSLLRPNSIHAKLAAVIPAEQLSLSRSALKMRLLKKLRCTLRYERQAWLTGAGQVAGVDEVGRGSLFGPVVAAAVILNPEDRIRGLRDSKLLLAERREVLAERIRERALCFAIAAVDSETIDAINIYQASRLAMLKAVEQLPLKPDHL